VKRTALLAPALAAGLLAGGRVVLAAGSVTGISASPSPATAGSKVFVTLTATGPCQVYVDFGDKTKAAHLSQYPATVPHVYAAAGKYVLRTFAYTSGNDAPGLSRCGGFADMELVVNPKPAVKALRPAQQLSPAAAPAAGTSKVTNPAPASGGSPAEPVSRARRAGGATVRTATPTPTPKPVK
jgi:hypothetical protein